MQEDSGLEFAGGSCHHSASQWHVHSHGTALLAGHIAVLPPELPGRRTGQHDDLTSHVARVLSGTGGERSCGGDRFAGHGTNVTFETLASLSPTFRTEIRIRQEREGCSAAVALEVFTNPATNT